MYIYFLFHKLSWLQSRYLNSDENADLLAFNDIWIWDAAVSLLVENYSFGRDQLPHIVTFDL